MKTIVTAVTIVALVFLGTMGYVFYRVQQQKPAVILSKLEANPDNREELIIQLQLARGDVIGPTIEVFADTTQTPELRSSLLELLFRRYQRDPDDRVIKIFRSALKDGEPIVRRQAAYGYAAYLDALHHVDLIESIADPDPDVREKATMVFVGHYWEGDKLWLTHMTPTQRERLVELAREQSVGETKASLIYLAESVVGKQIGLWIDEAIKALQSGDLTTSEKLLAQSLALNPDSPRAKVRLIRHHLAVGEKERAIQLAKKYDALLHIPKLKEPPTIDGDPTEDTWQQGVKIELKWQTTARWAALACEGRTDAYIGHYDGVIYITTLGYEANLDKLAVKHLERDSNVWSDDCIEIVFDPTITDKNWVQICVNAAGAIYDNAANGGKKNNYKVDANGKVWKDRGYWAMEFAIPADELDSAPITSDTLWAFNLFRARIGPASEHTVYWPTYGRTHHLAYYPLIVFDDAPAP